MIELDSEISHKQLYWRNHPAVTAWTRQNGLISALDMKKWFEKIDNDPTIKMFGIVEMHDGDIGTCGFTSISHVHGTAEFSLFIAPNHQKKGYGEEALIMLLKYGFHHMRFNLIFGETFEHNPARNLFKKIGFKEEGLLRQRYFKSGYYINSIPISITGEEFDNLHSH